MAFSGLNDPSTIHTDSMGILDGMWRGEEGFTGPKQKDADLWIFWERSLLTDCAEKNWDLDVKHETAHRTGKKDFHDV